MTFVKQPLLLHILLLIFGTQRSVVEAGRKGAGGGGDTNRPDEDPTEIPTSDYFFIVDTKKLLNNYSVVEGSRAKALEAVNVKKQTRYNNDQENLELCTYCRGKVGNITTDVECRDNSRQICWSSTGCYRLTFTDFTSQLYHIEKGCWNEDFNGMYGMCMKKCNTKREGLPDPAQRINCYCELCHGPMCNRELLISGARARLGAEITLLVALLVHLIGL